MAATRMAAKATATVTKATARVPAPAVRKAKATARARATARAGGWSDNNQIIDGETDYRVVLEYYKEIAMDILNNSSNYPPEL